MTRTCAHQGCSTRLSRHNKGSYCFTHDTPQARIQARVQARRRVPRTPIVEQMLDGLSIQQSIADQANQRLLEIIGLLRSHDVTWDEMGNCLGITASGVHQRFSRYKRRAPITNHVASDENVQDALTELMNNRHTLERVKDRQREIVVFLRRTQRVTWQEIADTLGVSNQAACKTFGRYCSPRPRAAPEPADVRIRVDDAQRLEESA